MENTIKKRKLTESEKGTLFENLKNANTKEFMTVLWWDIVNPSKNITLADSLNKGMSWASAFKKSKELK